MNNKAPCAVFGRITTSINMEQIFITEHISLWTKLIKNIKHRNHYLLKPVDFINVTNYTKIAKKMWNWTDIIDDEKNAITIMLEGHAKLHETTQICSEKTVFMSLFRQPTPKIDWILLFHNTVDIRNRTIYEIDVLCKVTKNEFEHEQELAITQKIKWLLLTTMFEKYNEPECYDENNPFSPIEMILYDGYLVKQIMKF